MHRKIFMAGGVVFAALFLVLSGAWAHEGEHEGQSSKPGHSRFEEGSGSSVIDSQAPGHEYSEKGEAYPEDHGRASEASTGETGMRTSPKVQPEEGSRGMSGETRQDEDRSRQGQVH